MPIDYEKFVSSNEYPRTETQAVTKFTSFLMQEDETIDTHEKIVETIRKTFVLSSNFTEETVDVQGIAEFLKVRFSLRFEKQ